MAYEIGTQVSFKKEERQTVAQFLCEIGTSFKFRLTDGGYVAARQIPVIAL